MFLGIDFDLEAHWYDWRAPGFHPIAERDTASFDLALRLPQPACEGIAEMVDSSARHVPVEPEPNQYPRSIERVGRNIVDEAQCRREMREPRPAACAKRFQPGARPMIKSCST